ncbi:TonB-dependent receptor [Ferrimonas marina]|uniref:TonB-dependent receptor n=1 Tax=Ferrimonas marina TaxID=299255 RepID=A0A1M5YSE2_9GAMM|nr:TonB-dependent receptor [Ferrimonas marina]SHI14728.1 TonB-dependent receptor [Ferrimonas marina]
MRNSVLTLTPVAAAIALLLPHAAQANDTPNDSEFQDVEVIRVSGTRASLSQAMNDKRFADGQVDVIAAEDIGVMPDPDIGDSLERVAGVQVQRDETGVANEVNIRGLPGYMTKVLYNGNEISTAINPNRNFSYDIMPSAFVSSVSVQKSSSADLKEGGLSGTVDMRSHRAFDADGRVTRVIGKTTNGSNSDEWGPDLTFLHSDTFANDTVGLAFGVNYLKEYNFTQSSTSNPHGNKMFEDDDGNEIFTTPEIRAELKDAERERGAAFVNLELRPTDNLTLFAESFYTKYNYAENRKRHVFRTNVNSVGLGDVEDTVIIDGKEYLTRGTFTEVVNHTDYNTLEKDSDIWVNTLEAQYELGDWQLSAGANFARSKMVFDAPNLMMNGKPMDMGFDFRGRSAIDFYYPDGIDMTDPNNYDISSMRLNGTQLGSTREANSDNFRFDVTRFTEITLGELAVTRFQFGASYTQEEMLSLERRANMNNAHFKAFLSENGHTPESIGYLLASPSRGSWFNGANASSGKPQDFLAPDLNRFFDLLSLDEFARYADEEGFLFETPDDLYEDTFAAYFRTDFEWGYNWSGNVGVRYVRTEQTSIKEDRDWTQGLTEKCDSIGCNLSLRAPVEDLHLGKTSDYWLPSLNLKYTLSDDMLVRFGASRTMARPNKEDMAGTTGYNNNANVINAPNPYLDPFLANNFDVSWEWYYNANSMVSAAYFYKGLDTLVTVTDTEVLLDIYDENGDYVREDYVTLRQRTNSEDVTLQGLELGFQTAFDYLPGLLANTGLSANYTYIDNDKPELLAAASKNNGNVVLYYSERKFDTRLSWTYRGSYLKDAKIEGSNNPATYYGASSRVTLATSYTPVENLRFMLSISNLFDQDTAVINDGDFIRAFSDNGRRLNAGVVLNF